MAVSYDRLWHILIDKHWSKTRLIKALSGIDIPVVVSTRIHHGLVTLNERLAPGRICAGRLPPQKAAVLLRLALTVTDRVSDLRRIFSL